MKFLDFKDQDFAKLFQSDKTTYEFEVTPGVIALDTTAIPYDENAKVVIKGAGYIKTGRNTVTITVSREGVEDTVYTIYVQKGENEGEEVYDFPYTGDYQVFVAPKTGWYKFEGWGARGGYARLNGGLGGNPGLGGYTSGTIKLNEGDTIYIYVGQQGTDAVCYQDSKQAWNGGGLGTWDRGDNEASGAGGGSTDFRLVPGTWNDKESLYSRIMVAGARWRSILDTKCRFWWWTKRNFIL